MKKTEVSCQKEKGDAMEEEVGPTQQEKFPKCEDACMLIAEGEVQSASTALELNHLHTLE
jgi:hypothetical protein